MILTRYPAQFSYPLPAPSCSSSRSHTTVGSPSRSAVASNAPDPPPRRDPFPPRTTPAAHHRCHEAWQSHRIANKRRASARHSSLALDATASDVPPLPPLLRSPHPSTHPSNAPLASPSVSPLSSDHYYTVT